MSVNIPNSIHAQKFAPSNFENLSDDAFVRQKQLVRDPASPGRPTLWPFSAPTYYRKIKAGTLPRPFKLSERVSAQKVGEIKAINQAWAEGKSDDEMREVVDILHAKRAAQHATPGSVK